MREIYRILDANFNRAREALRVIEDFARFALDDARLAEAAKQMRSRLHQAAEAFPAGELLASRDTPGDVGTALTTPTETHRADAAAVVSAACKRLSEALRSLAEYAKVIAPAGPAGEPAAFESLRYEAYTLQQRLELRLTGPARFHHVRLYVLLTSRLCRRDALETAAAAIEGGAECLQLREKHLPDRERLDLARRLREVTARGDALLIVNDRPDVAAAAGADGVHLGQDDLPVAAARRVLPSRCIVGKSTHTPAQARSADREGADYIAVGPMFPTTTKDAGPIAGPEALRRVVQEISRPVVAVGGITAENVGSVVEAGARCVAVCSAVIAADDPAAAAAAIRRQMPDRRVQGPPPTGTRSRRRPGTVSLIRRQKNWAVDMWRAGGDSPGVHA